MSDSNGIFAGEDTFDIARRWLDEAVATEPNDPNAIALSTVDSAMALGSFGSVATASASQRRAMSKGSSPANIPLRSLMSWSSFPLGSALEGRPPFA